MEEHTRFPEPNADLEQILRFALTYNGYRRLARDPNLLHGVIRPVLDAVDSRRGVPEWAGLDLLRGTLFHLQRSTHHVGHVSPDEEIQMRALAAAIGRLARRCRTRPRLRRFTRSPVIVPRPAPESQPSAVTSYWPSPST